MCVGVCMHVCMCMCAHVCVCEHRPTCARTQLHVGEAYPKMTGVWNFFILYTATHVDIHVYTIYTDVSRKQSRIQQRFNNL